MKNINSLLCRLMAFNYRLSAIADDRVAKTFRGRFGFFWVFIRTAVVFLATWFYLLDLCGVNPLHQSRAGNPWPFMLMPLIGIIIWYYFHEVRHATWRLVDRMTR